MLAIETNTFGALAQAGAIFHDIGADFMRSLPGLPSLADQEAFLRGEAAWKGQVWKRPAIEYMDGDVVWFAVRTNPRCEDKAIASLVDAGFDAFAPKGQKIVIHNRTKKRIEREFALLTGYVFLAMPTAERRQHWGIVRGCQGVKAPIGVAGRPIAFPTQDIEALRKSHEEGRLKLRSCLRGPGESFRVGEKLRIADGPFAGFFADVIDVGSRKTIRLIMEVMGRATEIDFPVDGPLERA